MIKTNNWSIPISRKKKNEYRVVKRFIRHVLEVNHTPELIRYVAESRRNMMLCKAITAAELQGEGQEISRLYGLLRQAAGKQRISFEGLKKKLLPVAECLLTDSDADASECYRVLGIPTDATESQVRKAYIRKARQTHPDTGNGTGADFIDVHRAYRVLSESRVGGAPERNRKRQHGKWIEFHRFNLHRGITCYSLFRTNLIILVCLIGFLVCCALLADWFFRQNVLVGDSISFLNRILLCKA